MILSMTGYGRAEKTTDNEKFIVEIRSLNGKNADISLKSSIIPKEKDIEVRQYIAQQLVRGNIDLFATIEYIGAAPSSVINKEILQDYYKQIEGAIDGFDIPSNYVSGIIPTLLKLPNVLETQKSEMSSESWSTLFEGIKEAVASLIEFRKKEGEILRDDIALRVKNIFSYVAEVEKYEQERISSVKERLLSRIQELEVKVDDNRLEQELIFYIEKLDINEEKVRLRQHCNYFLETMESETHPGKKLGFIAQEMGREINTMGSKANHAEIQKWVVRMKDELEKIKEQSLNII